MVIHPKPFAAISAAALHQIRRARGYLSDYDGTMSIDGMFAAKVVRAIYRARDAGKTFSAITGRGLGWGHMMASTFPFNHVVAENGGAYFYKTSSGKVEIRFAEQREAVRNQNRMELLRIAKSAIRRFPELKLTADNFCGRVTDVTLDIGEHHRRVAAERIAEIRTHLEKFSGIHTTVSSIHVHLWFGEYSKASMTALMYREQFGIALRRHPESLVYFGDSFNDEPMFRFFPHSIGVRNVERYLSQMRYKPTWITRREEGHGFVEAMNKILRAP